MNAVLKPRPVIQREHYSRALADEFWPLLQKQWHEIANFKDSIPLDPNFSAYARADQEKRLLVLTARQEGQLIGYSVFFLVFSPHYQSTLFAINDVIYVSPEHRKGRLGLTLVRESERWVKSIATERQVRVKISWHVKLCNDFHELLTRLGYEIEEQSMGKVL
jgi:GNAT superfamily N-acetyltransferase